jgi:polyisoprenoid-binding protein YceI
VRWEFEPGHTAAEFRSRHMMVTWVRGHFKGVTGTLEFDPEDPARASVRAEIDARGIWTGEPERDAHLRSADFLDAENHPTITFASRSVQVMGRHEFRVTGDLTIRGVTREVGLDVEYLGQWETPYWEDGVDKGPMIRAGFVARGRIDRHDYGVSWNSALDRGGVVERIRIRNMHIKSTDLLFWFELTYIAGAQGGNFPSIYRDIVFEDITVDKVGKVFHANAPKGYPLKDVTLRNVRIKQADELFTIDNVDNLVFDNVEINGQRVNGVLSWK